MSRPDEGLIHAWLDGELEATEAARVAQLVKDDGEWAAAAAEARGLIAASARIVGALDDVPAHVVPARRAGRGTPEVARGPRSPGRGIPWSMLRAAAVIVVVTGVAVVTSRGGDDGGESLVTPEHDAGTPIATAAAPSPALETRAAESGPPSRTLTNIPATARDAGGVGNRVAPAMKALAEVTTAGDADARPAAGALAANADGEQCFREASANGVLHRVTRISDSAAAPRANASGAQSGAQAGARNEFAARAATITYRMNGDSLFVALATGDVRVALRVECPVS